LRFVVWLEWVALLAPWYAAKAGRWAVAVVTKSRKKVAIRQIDMG